MTALGLDFVPRNASRVPTDIVGSLGTSALRWLRTYSTEYFIGDAANNLKIYEPSSGIIRIENANNDYMLITDGTVEMWTNNVRRFRVNDSGIVWSEQADASIPKAKVNGALFTSYELVDYGSVDEDADNTIKSNLPNDAFVLVEFQGEGNGSRALVWAEDNFSSGDVPLPIAWINQSTAAPTTHSNFVRAGADIKESSSDFSSGKVDIKLHIYYI